MLALSMTGTGMLTLPGSNTYTGPTNLSAGTLAVNGSLASASTVGVGNNATLAGAGTIGGNTTVTGNGAIYLSGGTIGGTLAATGGNWNGAGTVVGLVTASSNRFTIGSGANLTAVAGLSVSGGTLAGAGTLTGSLSYTSPATSNFPGNVAGSGAAVTLGSGAGVLVLGGSNTYTGATNANAGTLIVNGTHSGGGAYTIASLATLGGTGTISGANTVTLNAGGFVAPGAAAGNNNVGTLTLPNFATSGGGTVNFDLAFATTAGNGANDLVAVTGNLSLGGTTNIAVNLYNTTVLSNGNYELFTYGGSLTGNASSLALANSGFLTSRQTYQFDTGTSHAIFLDIIGGPANLTWTGSNAASWDTSSSTANWIDQNSTHNNFVTGDTTNFTTSNSGAVTINAPVAPGSVNVSGSYTFSGPGKITAATALTVQSPAALTIANTNDYTLGTNLQSGSIILGTNNALPVAGTVTMGETGSHGTLDLAGYSQTIGNLAMGAGASGSLGYQQTITASTGSSTLTVNGAGDSIYGGTITDAAPTSGTLGLTVSNGTLDLTSGTLAYTGLPTATYHGATTVNSGVLLAATLPNTSAVVVNGGSLSATSYSSSANLSVAGGAAASIAGGNLSLAGVSNSGSVNFTASSGTISLAGLSGGGTTTFASGASFPTLTAGVVTVAGPAAITNANGGTANLNGTTAAIASLGNATVNLSNSTALTIAAGTQTSGAIIGGGSLASGPGLLTLGANNSGFTGNVAVSGGTLYGTALNAFGSSSSTRTITVGSGATLSFGAAGLFGGHYVTTVPALVVSGTVTNVGNVNNPLNNVTLNGGVLTSTAGVSNTWGRWNVNGTVTLTGNSLITAGGSNGWLTLANGTGNTNTNFDVQSGTLTVATPLLDGRDTPSPYNAHATSLTKLSPGLLVLQASNSYSGGTTISGGTLAIGGSGVLGNGNYTGSFANNSAFVFNSSSNQTFSGAMSGAGTLTQNGPGWLYLSGGGISYSGPTLVNCGRLTIAGMGNLSTSVLTIASGGTLERNNPGANALLFQNVSTAVLQGEGTFLETGASQRYFSWDQGATLKMGQGGLIDVEGGHTILSYGSLLNSSQNQAGLTVNNSGNFDVWDTTNFYIDALNGNGTISRGDGLNTLGGTLTIGVAGGSGSFNGTIRNGTSGGVPSLTKTGGGIQVLSGGSISYTGGTIVSGGTLDLQNATGFASSGINNAATLQFDLGSGTTETYANVITGGGPVVKTGPGTLVLTNTSTYTGVTTINGGTLQLGTGVANQDGALYTSNGGTVADNAALFTTSLGSNGSNTASAAAAA